MRERLALCYHAVSSDWPAALTATPDQLDAQLALLARRGYEGVTFSRLVEGAGGARRAVALTFDDAFASVYELALPIVRKHGLVATVFVPIDYPDSGREMAWDGLDDWPGRGYGSELGCMSWEQLRELAELGWEIGSHTCSHPYLTQLEDDALVGELTRSRGICSEQIGCECRSIAYPYGDWDDRVADATLAAGYTSAGTLSGRFYRDSPLRYPRVGIYREDGSRRFALKISPLTRKLRSSDLWGRIDRARARRSLR